MNLMESIRGRFQNRPSLTVDELMREFGCPDSPGTRDLFLESLRVFEEEYGVSVFLLRAGDSLDVFTESPPTKNPLRWLFNQAAIEDKTSELNYHLKRRRRALGLPLTASPMTVGEYVDAWLGGRSQGAVQQS